MVVSFLRRHIGNLFLAAVLLLLLFHPDAKPWVLRRLFDIGLYRANLEKEKTAAPEPVRLRLTDSAGRPLPDSLWRGKVVFLNFWAPWCPPCRAELPSIESLYQKFKADPSFVFLLVDVDANPTKSSALLRKNGITLPQAMPLGTPDARLFGGTLPTTVIIDLDGNLIWKHEGLLNYNTADFASQLARLKRHP